MKHSSKEMGLTMTEVPMRAASLSVIGMVLTAIITTIYMLSANKVLQEVDDVMSATEIALIVFLASISLAQFVASDALRGMDAPYWWMRWLSKNANISSGLLLFVSVFQVVAYESITRMDMSKMEVMLLYTLSFWLIVTQGCLVTIYRVVWEAEAGIRKQRLMEDVSRRVSK